MAGEHITAKDFRTWRGTLVAFNCLTEHVSGRSDPEQAVLGALDATAEVLGNTRAVARASPCCCARNSTDLGCWRHDRPARDSERRPPAGGRVAGVGPTNRTVEDASTQWM